MPIIDESHVRQYSDNINLALQQEGSRLRDTVMVETITGESKSFDFLGAVEAQELQGRHADTPLVDPEHSRRWIIPTPKVIAHLIDTQDKVRMLVDPTSSYVMTAVMAIGRAMDQAIINAVKATVVTGKVQGSGTASFPGGNTIASDFVESGSTAASGLTIGKLREVRKLLTDSMAFPSDPITVVCSGTQIQNLLATTEVTSSDFNTVKALVNGEVNTFLGMRFKTVLPAMLPYTAGTDVRSALVYTRMGMLLGEAESMFTRVSERPDKNHATQAYVRWDGGAVRMYEPLAYEILCDESP